MIFAKLDVNISDHPRVLEAGIEAFGLWCWGLAYCRKHETDGRIPKLAAKVAIAHSFGDALSTRLVTVGLWRDISGDAFEMVGYSAKNETRAQIDERRMFEANRKKAYRFRQKQSVPLSVPIDVPRGTTTGCPDSDSDSVKSLSLEDGSNGEPGEPTKAQKLAMWEADHREAFCRGLAAGKGGPHVWSGGMHDQGALNASVKAFGSRDSKGVARDAKRLLRWTEAAGQDFAQAMVARKSSGGFAYALTGQGFAKWLNEEETNKIKETA